MKMKQILLTALSAAALILAACSDGGGGGGYVASTGGGIEPPSTESRGDISLTDTPMGYASIGGSYKTSGGTTVKTRDALVSAISKGGVIIIDGMIDMSEGKLVPEGSVSTDSTTALDDFMKKQLGGKYQTYDAWVKAYSNACDLTTEDGAEYNSEKSPFNKYPNVKNSKLYSDLQALNTAYRNAVTLKIQSNTTLIGNGPNCGMKGGRIQITSVKNVQIRNLTVKDAFDPFPHHEVDDNNGNSDGYNAELDCVVIEGSENVWIDHCTFEDTITTGYVNTNGSTKEKWQTYDGLCDIKNKSSDGKKTTNVTVSNCLFRDHDKTMLIGSSDSDGDNSERFVTLVGNYFYNCGQRLPMVRNTTIHILNNYYDASNPHYKQQYAVGVRKNAIIYAENNYFGSGILYSFSNSEGEVYASGNGGSKSTAMDKTKISGSTLFSSAVKAYTYTAVTAEQAKTNAVNNAGAGYTLKK